MSYPQTRQRDSIPTLLRWRILRRHYVALATFAILCLLPFLVSGLAKSLTKSTLPVPSANSKPEERARLSSTVSVQAFGRGNPVINLSDGHDLVTSYVGPEELRVALEQNQADPLGLASADFDEDGVPDLVSAYGYQGRGIVTLLRGNVDSIYPNGPRVQQRGAGGAFIDAPFLSTARVFPVPLAADFIGTGDFDGDSHGDAVVGTRGSDKFYLLSGDGHGGLQPAREMQLPGVMTAFVTGEINRADGLTDIVIGITGPDGPKVVIFEGPEGAFRSRPEIFAAPATVTSLALGQLDSDLNADLVVAAGRDLLLLHGRDRKLSLNEKSRAEVRGAVVEKRSFSFSIRSLAVGQFSGKARPDVALLSEDGMVSFVNQGPGSGKRGGRSNALAKWQSEAIAIAPWPGATQLIGARLSSNPVDDLVALDPLNRQLHVLTRSRLDATASAPFDEFDINQTNPRDLSLDLESLAQAVLPMNLNGDALNDLVILREGQSAPTIVTTTPASIITVNSNADTNVRDTVVTLREAILLANGELLKSALTANEQSLVNGTPAPGLDEIDFNIPTNGPVSPSDSNAPTESKAEAIMPTQRLSDSYGKLPLSFEVNEGQHDSRVKFLARGSGYNLSLNANEAVIELSPSERQLRTKGQTASVLGWTKASRMSMTHGDSHKSEAVRIKLLNANPDSCITATDELPGKVNYFIGADPAKWRTNIRTYAKVKYEQVYPGIDLIYYGHEGQLEYDFVVAPGADPSIIKLDYSGTKHINVNDVGDLVLQTPAGKLVQHKPVVYQADDTGRQEISSRYELAHDHVEFRIGEYDRSRSLLIDPVLGYSTYLGASGEQFKSIAVDSAGNAYLPSSASNSGNNDALIRKINSSGTALVYSIFIGGSGTDGGASVAADADGNAYVLGTTNSTNFPTTNALQGSNAGGVDTFVAKVNPTGSALLYSTYLGGGGDDQAVGIAVDGAGSAYVTGNTPSVNFPLQNPLQASNAGGGEAFISKLNAAGSALVYSTYLGGSGNDGVAGIAVTSGGNACVTGGTTSINFPTMNPLQSAAGGAGDAFVTKLNPTGTACVYSTYLGGAAGDGGSGVAIDGAGNTYIAGSTDSTNFPTANALQPNKTGGTGVFSRDAFVTKINAAGTAFVYSTYLGGGTAGNGNGAIEQASGIAADSDGNAYVTGEADSVDFPTVNPLPNSHGGAGDAFVTAINATGSVITFSTYLGGGSYDFGVGIAVDALTNIYVTGVTFSTDFPVAHPLQGTLSGTLCSFVSKIQASLTNSDLAITKQHFGNFTVGTNGVYNLMVSNVGAVSTTGIITVKDTLPNGLSFISSTGNGWSCSVAGQKVTCVNSNNLAPNTSSSLSLTVGVGTAAAPGVTNTAVVENSSDPFPENNTANDPTTVNVPCVRSITVGQTVNGELVSASCRSPIRGGSTYADRYTFTGTAGQNIAINLSATFDSYLYLVGPTSAIIASDDDGGGGTNSRIPAVNGFFALPANGTYTIEATSLSPNQTGAYTLSLSAGTAGCVYNISPSSQSFNSGGGTGSITVSTSSGCNWSAVSNATWISITSGASGSDSGAVGFTVAQNTSAQDRTGTLTVAGQTFTVTQSGNAACSYFIMPTSQSYPTAGGSGNVGVNAPPGCNWTAGSNANFIMITSGSFGVGSGIVAYSVSPNTSGAPRTGTLTIAGQTFTVTQGAGNPNVRTITLGSPLPKVLEPIIIDGSTQPGFAGTPIIEISGVNLASAGGGSGLNIPAGNSTIRSLAINHFSSPNRDAAILLITNGNNIVEGCYLGTDTSGTNGFTPTSTTALSSGITVRASSNNRIGGTALAARNLISGNDGSAVQIDNGATSNLIQGNYLGTDVTGSISLGFQRIGVYIQGARGNTIGGTAAGSGNLISGNRDYGIYLQDDAHNNLIAGNLIGTNASGSAAIPNGNAGVFINNPTGASGSLTLDNAIGGTTSAGRNLISGNDPYGIVLGTGASNTLVQGNYIGTNFSGQVALANGYGVIATQATGSTIGGALNGARNVISGNRLTGVNIGFLINGQLGGTGTTIQGNYIGTDALGTGSLGNQQDGVFVEVQSIIHTIQDNRIAFNGNNGVRIPNVTANPGTPGVRIQIVDNLIYSNSLLGIDLGDPGITPNDPLDADAGANLQQNSPVLTAFTGIAPHLQPKPVSPEVAINVNATLNSAPNTTFLVHWFFSGSSQCSNNQQTSVVLDKGKVPGVVTNGSGDASFSFSVNLPPGIDNGTINSTATDPLGNTSELSGCLAVNSSPSPTLKLSSGSYNVAENSGSASVTITRSGDSSAPATIDYETSDTAGASNCNVPGSGNASSRCDYERTVGTLRFAAGETSKIILIPIVDDVYAEGNESFIVTLSNASGAVLGSPSVATVTITDNDSTTGTTNPFTQAGYFVRMQYLDFFSREPDTSGLNFWTNEITSCGSNAQCTEIKRVNVSAAFYLSIEFRDTGYLVERIYRSAYGNGTGTSTLGGTHQFSVPVIRFEEFLPDTQEIGRGVVVGQTGWEQVLENNKQAFLNAFVQRARFTGTFPAGMTPAQYVDALNVNAGGALSTAERNQLVTDLTNGAKTRAQVLRVVAEDADLNTAENNRAFVLMQFYGYLRRNPNDAPDADYTGYDFWLGKLNQFNGNFVNAEMVKAFIVSDEYRHRFGP